MNARIQKRLRPLEALPTDERPRLLPLHGIRAVVFDIYGTLLISGSGDVGSAQAQDNTEALADALDAIGHDREQAEAGIERFFNVVRADHQALKSDGIDYPEIEVRDVWRRVFNLDAASAETLAIEYECRANPVWPMPGFPAILEDLSRDGLKLGIVSNAQFYTPIILETLTERTLSQLGFDERLCAWSFQERCAKPAAALFAPVLQGLREIDIQPSQALYVGNDMLNDIYTATTCGLRTCLFAGDRRSLRRRSDDPRCTDLEPDTVITRLDQLPSLLH